MCVHRRKTMRASQWTSVGELSTQTQVGEEKEREREKIKRGKIKRNIEINQKIMLTVSGGWRVGCVTGACTNQTTRNENRAEIFGHFESGNSLFFSVFSLLCFLFFCFSVFLFFRLKFLSGLFGFVREGAEETGQEREKGGCYAALPPSSSTLQHNSTRTQTFNRNNNKKPSVTCRFFFLTK